MGLFTGSFTLKSGVSYTMRLVTGTGNTGTFKIIGDVTTQTGNNISKAEDIFEPIRGTKLNFTIKDFDISGVGSFYEEELKGINNDDIEIQIADNNGVYIFVGYLLPKGIELNKYYDYPAISMIAHDGLALLKQIPFDLSGTYTLSGALSALMLSISTQASFIFLLTDWQETNMTSASPALIRFDIGLFSKGNRNATYWDVLEGILRRFGFILCQDVFPGDEAQWICVKRDAMGNNSTIYQITISSAAVSTASYDDSETITTANIEKNYYEGQLNAIQKVITNFEWDNTNPSLVNSNFQTWNAANTIPTSWEVESGAFSKQTNAAGNIVARTSNDGIMYQSARVIKPAYQTFNINLVLQVLVNSLAPDEGVLNYEGLQVVFIDPTGTFSDYYLKSDGDTTTTPTWLTYNQEISIANRSTVFTRSINQSLASTAFGYGLERIVEVRLWGNREDTLASGIYLDYVQFLSVTINNYTASIPDFRETLISESFAGDQIENTFSLSDQTPYNAVGAMQVYNGSSWVVATNWGSGYSFDETYTRMINAQTKANLLYMKVKIGPTYFAGRVFTDVITFGGVEFVPVMFLRNYLKSTIDIQMIELRNDTPGSVTETYLIED